MAVLEERKTMLMAAEMTPPMRYYLYLSKGKDEVRLWELCEVVPPSTAPELECDKTEPPRREGERQRWLPSVEPVAPFHVEQEVTDET